MSCSLKRSAALRKTATLAERLETLEHNTLPQLALCVARVSLLLPRSQLLPPSARFRRLLGEENCLLECAQSWSSSAHASAERRQAWSGESERLGCSLRSLTPRARNSAELLTRPRADAGAAGAAAAPLRGSGGANSGETDETAQLDNQGLMLQQRSVMQRAWQ